MVYQSNTLFWNIYSRCQSSTYRLMPYQDSLWKNFKKLRLEPDLTILNLGLDASNIKRFAVEKHLAARIMSLGYGGALSPPIDKNIVFSDTTKIKSISPLQRLPFADDYFDRVICTLNGEGNAIFLVNELKRVLKITGLIVLVDKKTGLRNLVGQIRDHLWRIRNIQGIRRQARAVSRLMVMAPALVLKTALDLRLKSFPAIGDVLKDNEISYSSQLDTVGDNIYTGVIKPKKRQDLIEQAFIKYSMKYNLQFPNIQPVETDIINVTLRDLQNNPALLDELTLAYQQIFGSSEIWGEGAFCDLDQTHLISLEAYNVRSQTNDLLCSCGGTFKPCYSKEYFRQFITSQLRRDNHFNPFCSLYVVDKQITGFMWSVIATLDACIERILNTPNWVDRENWGVFIKKVRSRLIDHFDLTPTSKLLFLDDLGILPNFRRGIKPMMALSRQAFSYALANQCQRTLFWTSKKSPLFKIVLYSAFKEVLANKDGITFMYTDDIVPASRILQHDPRSMLPILVKNAKIVEAKTEITP